MKVILSILIMFFVNDKVLAEEYYSNYSDFSNYQLEEVVESDIVNVETKRVYNKYFNRFDGGYYGLGENPIGYPYLNTNSYKETDFSSWSSEYPTDKYGRIIESKKVCDNTSCSLNHLEFRYKDRAYFHYIEKPILLEADSALHGYIKDENDYTLYYRYQTRDKLEIKDNIVITDVGDFIDNYISSTVQYQILGDIDYSKNGNYNIEIKTDFISVPIMVKLLIEDSIENKYIDSLNKKIDEIDKLNKSIILKQEALNSSNKEIMKLNNELDDTKILLDKNEKTYQNKIQSVIEDSRLKQEKLENSFSNVNEELSFCKADSLRLNELINKQNSKINNLSKVNKSIILDNKADEHFDTDNDMIKKLDLCNNVNENLESKLNEKHEYEKQNTFLIVFIGIIILLINCFLIKIKSIKKNY